MQLKPPALNISREEYRKRVGCYPEELAKKLEVEWNRGVEIGIETGHLTRRDDGALVGRGNPADGFDAVDACDT